MKNKKHYIILVFMAVLVLVLPIALVVFSMSRETQRYDGDVAKEEVEASFDETDSERFNNDYQLKQEAMTESASPMVAEDMMVEESVSSGSGTAEGALYSAGYVNSAMATQEKLIIYNDMTVETKNFNNYINKLEEITVKSEAYIQQQNVYNGTLEGDEIRNAYYIIRVPKDKVKFFSEHFNALEGKVTRREVNIENVTQRYLDIQRRVNINKAKEERLTKLLKKADNIEDLITIEKEIAQLVTERESMQTDLIELEHNIKYDYYTIHVNEVREYQEIKVEKSFKADIDYTFENSIKHFVDFLQNVVLFFVYTWIIWLLSIIVAVVVVIIVKNKLKKKKLENQKLENKKNRE